MKDVFHTGHSVQEAAGVAHVANVELELGVGVLPAHVVLLLFIAGKDADFPDVGCQKSLQDGMAERTRPPGYQENLVGKIHVTFLGSLS